MEKSDVIKQLIEKSGYSRRAFAEKIGLPPTTLQSMLSRGMGKATIDNVIKVCKGLGITIDELEKMAESNTLQSNLSVYESIDKEHSNITYIPIIGSIAAGVPMLAEENIEGYLPMLDTLLNKRKKYFYLTVKGTSMNLEFPDGSFVLVEETPFVENGQIAVVKVNGYEATVKKISKSEDVITLIPLSNDPVHEPKTYNLIKDDIKIVGRVIQAVKTY
ncbi:TPA: LexA family protein [Bacillus mobilis]|uniref:LexA family protein n=1 Tax=Bacillus mobilis TaxID=2026190 RepID=UPI0011A7716A|nr:LexA family transcriptional regulator [Bacillus mobilis]HDX9641463.1 helix-turn-helix domain-containing protein [Bacillus mobilis]